jgi:hypothetical protein
MVVIRIILLGWNGSGNNYIDVCDIFIIVVLVGIGSTHDDDSDDDSDGDDDSDDDNDDDDDDDSDDDGDDDSDDDGGDDDSDDDNDDGDDDSDDDDGDDDSTSYLFKLYIMYAYLHRIFIFYDFECL